MITINHIAKLLKENPNRDWLEYGNVSVQNQGDLYLFSYTREAMWENRWNDFEQLCRGLIINGRTGEIVARPFRKFFNWGQVCSQDGKQAYPNRGTHLVNVLEKKDGCFLGNTKVNLWGGGTIPIRDIVNKGERPTLIGRNSEGAIVPCEIIDVYNNGTKENWLLLTVDFPVSKLSGGGAYENKIPVTENHHIYLNGRYQPAENAMPGDVVINYGSIPDENVIHLIKSGLLGDGSLTPLHNSFRYQESHVSKYAEYIEELEKGFGETLIKTRTVLSGYGSEMLQISTKTYKSLDFLREEWYPGGTKAVPQDLSWVDDFTIAKWYMDDGNLFHTDKQTDRAGFSTNSFEYGDVIRLAQKLETMYGVSTTVYDSKGWIIRVNAGKNNDISLFWQKISPFIHPCMRYKLPEEYRSVAYISQRVGTEKTIAVEGTITNVERLLDDGSHTYFSAGKVGFDIKTTTGNYFVKGMLVHNSLGILYRDNGYKIATRGSFNSEQAEFATEFLNNYFNLSDLPDELTLLFEIIYPENRIVVNYGNTEDLVLLAAINRFTGEEYPFYGEKSLYALHEKYGFSLPQIYNFNNVTQILEAAARLEGSKAEGFVLVYSDGERFKIKGDEYLELHKLVSSLTRNTVFDAWSKGIQYDCPDEFKQEVSRYISEFEQNYAEIMQIVEDAWKNAPKANRKEFALYVTDLYPKYIQGLLFSKLDGRLTEEQIRAYCKGKDNE